MRRCNALSRLARILAGDSSLPGMCHLGAGSALHLVVGEEARCTWVMVLWLVVGAAAGRVAAKVQRTFSAGKYPCGRYQLARDVPFRGEEVRCTWLRVRGKCVAPG